MEHFYALNNMSKEELMSYIELTDDCRHEELVLDKQVFVSNLFFEPSTRTRMSFLVAEKKLGMEILDFQVEASSVKKGESLYDTVRTLQAIGSDVCVIRHESDNWLDDVSGIDMPLINGGAGAYAHPSQSMLDAYTIYKEYGRFEGLNIVIAGDIKHSRVAHSNIDMFKTLGANVYVSGAPEFMDENVSVPFVDMDEAVEMADVMMMLRIQHERHESDYGIDSYLNEYGLNLERESRMQDHAIIMHPAPINRGGEIDTRLVECDRSRIFNQMENGVYVRMAIIIKQLLNWRVIDEYQISKR